MRFNTNGSEAMRIDSSQNLLVGKTTTAFGTAGIALRGTVADFTRDGGTPINVNRLTDDGSLIDLHKNSTAVGSIGVRGSTNLYVAFRTEANGDGCGLTGSAASTGAIIPSDGDGDAVDNHIDLGASGTRFDDVFCVNVNESSDRNLKQDIEELSEAEKRVAVRAKGLLRKYRLVSSVLEKGDDARIHFGIIAQDLQAAFEAEGLDPARYAMWCSDTWTDEDTGEEVTRQSIRYTQLLAFIISAI
jgi:hypothetical protein